MITDEEYLELTRNCANLMLDNRKLRDENSVLRDKDRGYISRQQTLVMNRAYWRTTALAYKQLVMELIKGGSHRG